MGLDQNIKTKNHPSTIKLIIPTHSETKNVMFSHQKITDEGMKKNIYRISACFIVKRTFSE